MIKLINTLIIFIFLSSCSTNKSIEDFMKEEINNNENKSLFILKEQKLKVSNTLGIYLGKKRGNMNSQAKSFNQSDFDMLLNKYKNDTLFEYWTSKESEKFKFNTLVKYGETSKYRDSILNIDIHKEVYSYSFSKPIFIKNKKTAIFSMFKSKGVNNIVDDCAIIMVKKNNKWIFFEKIHSTKLH